MEDTKDIPIAAKLKGPGPARYALPSTCGYIRHDFSKHMKPAWTFGHRFWKQPWKSPGPVYYVHPEMTRAGKDGTPVYSMLGRQRDPKEFQTPAPCTYLTEHVHPQGERHAPSYTMGARFPIRRYDSNPAPNRYGLPPLLGSNQINKRSYPSYSMTKRSEIGSYSEDLARTPGPGQYQAIEPNVVYNRGPIYSLQSRTPMPQDKTAKPGPGQHRPEMVYINKHAAPAHSMGIRHSQYITPLIIEG